jgi:ABC-type multidrug transport system permease subunit
MKIDKLIEKKFLFYPTIFTLIIAVISCILFSIQLDNRVQLFSFALLLIGICTVLLQILLFNYQTHNKVNIEHDCQVEY